MIIDFFLVLTFALSLFLIWYRVSLKLPELIAIPDQVITERLHEDSAKLRLFVLHIKMYYREERYKPVFWRFAGKTLYRFHLALLRLDNWTSVALRNIRARGVAVNGNGNGNSAEVRSSGDYWQKLQKQENTSSLPKNTRIEEVRKK